MTTENWPTEHRQALSRLAKHANAARKARVRADVDERFPHLSEEDREAIAGREYRLMLSYQGKTGGRPRKGA